MPRQARSGDKPAAQFNGRMFDGFQTAVARTDYVLGEFPWQVRADDTATVSDYIDPPLMLSAERTPQEVTWSLGEYVTGRQIWDAFKLPGDPPPAVGVYANQPSPYAGKSRALLGVCTRCSILLLLGVCGVRLISAARQPIFQGELRLPAWHAGGVLRHARLRGRQPRAATSRSRSAPTSATTGST